jgi:chromosome segregation ATPase
MPDSMMMLIDILQTAVLAVIAASLIYAMVRLERALNTAAERVKTAFGQQRDLLANYERLWRKLEALEATINTTRAGITSMHRRMDETEARGRLRETPPNDH